MSLHQIQAITGHTTLKEIERYTKAARQKLMAEMVHPRRRKYQRGLPCRSTRDWM
jgi:hypothetical protein